MDTSPPWQSARSHDVDDVCCEGGAPWHAPHAFSAPDRSVHDGAAAGSASPAPWHATPAHRVPSQVGTALRAAASPEKATSTVPFMWPGSVIAAGTTWQLEQAIGVASVGSRCDACAPVSGQGLSP